MKELDVYNPLKGRNETIRIEISEDCTTYFEEVEKNDDILSITDTDAGLLIQECGCTKPILIAVESRESINYSQKGALKAIADYCVG